VPVAAFKSGMDGEAGVEDAVYGSVVLGALYGSAFATGGADQLSGDIELWSMI